MFDLHLHLSVLVIIGGNVSLKAGKKPLTVGILLACRSGVWCLGFQLIVHWFGFLHIVFSLFFHLKTCVVFLHEERVQMTERRYADM